MVALIFEVKTMYVDKKGQDAHSWQRETEITDNCLLSFAFIGCTTTIKAVPLQ